MARLIESVDGKFQALNSKPGTSERAVPPSIEEWHQTKIRGSRFVTVSRILAGFKEAFRFRQSKTLSEIVGKVGIVIYN